MSVREHSVRIIGGQWRGRRLKVCPHPQLRPSPDRLKTTLFNWLQGRLSGGCYLDLFAGSGALGVEALSRGAQHVVLVEPQPLLVQQLKRSLSELGTSAAEVVPSSAATFLAHNRQRFDGIFADPPFEQFEPLLPFEQLATQLKPEGWLYVESPYPLPVPAHWSLQRQQRFASVWAQLLQPTAAEH